jgi:hypothetical protein
VPCHRPGSLEPLTFGLRECSHRRCRQGSGTRVDGRQTAPLAQQSFWVRYKSLKSSEEQVLDVCCFNCRHSIEYIPKKIARPPGPSKDRRGLIQILNAMDERRHLTHIQQVCRVIRLDCPQERVQKGLNRLNWNPNT